MSAPVKMDLHIPTGTILKVVLSLLVIAVVVRLWPFTILFTFSVIVAVALEPLVEWALRHRISRGWSTLVLATLVLGGLGLCMAYVVPQLVTESVALLKQVPQLLREFTAGFGRHAWSMRRVTDQVVGAAAGPDVMSKVSKVFVWGTAAVAGFTTFVLVIIVALYLLLDGRRLYAWLLAYVPRSHRQKVAETMPEVAAIVRAYVRGQFFTSVLFGIFAAIALSLLKVPGVLPLALLAALCDVIPVVGIVVATAPAALLALTVSGWAAVSVVGLYVAYHLIETYVLIPRVYGNTLRLSTLTVLLALVIGAELQGILGAILILPLVAAYPIVERIWLRGYLGRDVIAEHTALANVDSSDREDVVDAILAGEAHTADHAKRRT